MRIGIFYGSTLDNTKEAAEQIKVQLESDISITIDLYDVATCDVQDMQSYDVVLIGCSTWNIGELQDDWYDKFSQLDTIDFTGKRVALFGCGDEGGYPDTYQDAIGIIGKHVRELGATIVGYWSTEGYDFIDSAALEDGKFMGLAIDNDNTAGLTDSRIQMWVQQLMRELHLESVHA
ncbi:MAG: flavodoxin FldA [Chloroflexi bacterium AL-W]|nr:flavodoxin FldA [Chloroflexi bacterium AL-N1]NOK67749.1 flavodoxin FldA [Chloroflexi bacterium AL-N10]NOK75481.1 flavodoxin FldA [Chloroflexi bacterium AL-N5]NOK82269.1 flavodoxin FldA [Chloroflexi bacterium AL-W]NOK90114.1 flavodoxin FldA [Chloroflexi bacterium AL-N15]